MNGNAEINLKKGNGFPKIGKNTPIHRSHATFPHSDPSSGAISFFSFERDYPLIRKNKEDNLKDSNLKKKN